MTGLYIRYTIYTLYLNEHLLVKYSISGMLIKEGYV